MQKVFNDLVSNLDSLEFKFELRLLSQELEWRLQRVEKSSLPRHRHRISRHHIMSWVKASLSWTYHSLHHFAQPGGGGGHHEGLSLLGHQSNLRLCHRVFSTDWSWSPCPVSVPPPRWLEMRAEELREGLPASFLLLLLPASCFLLLFSSCFFLLPASCFFSPPASFLRLFYPPASAATCNAATLQRRKDDFKTDFSFFPRIVHWVRFPVSTKRPLHNLG